MDESQSSSPSTEPEAQEMMPDPLIAELASFYGDQFNSAMKQILANNIEPLDLTEPTSIENIMRDIAIAANVMANLFIRLGVYHALQQSKQGPRVPEYDETIEGKFIPTGKTTKPTPDTAKPTPPWKPEH
jgi:hypothetical protein